MRHLALASSLVVLAAGCGGDEPAVTTATPAPVGVPPSAASTATATPEATPERTPTPVEEQEGGAGDEDAPRVPVDFTIDGEGITPPRVAVPPAFRLEVTVRNDLPSPVTVRLPRGRRLRVPATGRRRVRIDGLRPGEHAVDAGAAGTAVIVSGAEPGP